MSLPLGAPAPWFTAPTPSNPTFVFSSVAGRYVALAFLPANAEVRVRVMDALAAHRAILDDAFACVFVVVRDAEGIATAADARGLRWFLDADGAVSRLFGALGPDGEENPHWLVLDPSLRTLLTSPLEQTTELLDRMRSMAPPDQHAGVPLHAPVLIVPRIFEPALCRQLIGFYEQRGGRPSGVMREVDGRTVGVLDDFKRRCDADIEDPELRAAIRTRIGRRLLPEIEKAFQFSATRIERYIVACYDAQDGGYFRAHRDNTTAGTAHRKFAVSINLNAEEFEGGDLRFPEFGRRTYRPPTGGAVVFSCSLLHEATPVTRGRRYACLPFLFDEAGAAIREKNRHLIGQADPEATTAATTVA